MELIKHGRFPRHGERTQRVESSGDLRQDSRQVDVGRRSVHENKGIPGNVEEGDDAGFFHLEGVPDDVPRWGERVENLHLHYRKNARRE